ncbi:MAG TPA: glycine--tRNA ligase subunit beta [Thermoanaerobaculia bacterium]|nr:glycine--tRNA ligase subunit beta [Thermoanaerobaculia bacterium]
MAEFLLEILAEEIPASVLSQARNDLLRGLAEALAAERIEGTFFSHSTSRRLVLFSLDLPEMQDDHEVEAVGPSVKVAFDAEGRPTRAAEGFARGQGVAVEALRVVSTPKGEYVSVRKVVEGRYTSEILADAIPVVIAKMSFPRMMRWGDGRNSWIRPVHSVVCLIDGLVVPFSLFGVETGRTTFGHRTLAPGRIVVVGVDDYLAKLRAAFVETDYGIRRRVLVEKAEALAAEVGCSAVDDEALLDTLAHLVEWPGLIRGSFDPAYLELPEEILVTAMREHQKVLPTRDAAGALAPHFFAVADHVGDPKGHIARGNEWVLNARFADARFFWDDDGRIPLEERVPRLARLSFQEKLGDTLRKTERVEALAERLAVASGLGDLVPEATRAARLARADLVTDMVREFPDLQGVVGGLYAQRDGEAESVWQAVYDHYLPAGADDALPRDEVGRIVALADRLDTLAGFFALGLVPTGSRDPYALRRAALGVVRILLEGGIRLDLPTAIAAARGLHEVQGATAEEVAATLHPFLLERLRFLLERRGFKHDEIESVLTTDCPDVTDAAERVVAVAAVRKQPDFGSLAASFKRVQNILAQAGAPAGGELDPALMSDDSERQLASDFYQARGILDELIVARRYEEALSVMASLGPCLDRFFTDVMVLVEDEAVRANRLSLLAAMRDQFFRVARLSDIQA